MNEKILLFKNRKGRGGDERKEEEKGEGEKEDIRRKNKRRQK